MIQAHAPGKLHIAGEYAVVDPGHTAVSIAIDRLVTVSISSSESGSLLSKNYYPHPISWQRPAGLFTLDAHQDTFDIVTETIRVSERFLIENGYSLQTYDLTIESNLDSIDGKKYGLGSSGAVTVATIRGLLDYYGYEPTDEEVFKLGAISHLRLNSNGSFGDIAASTYTGWIAYTSFDRYVVKQWLNENLSTREIVSKNWPKFKVIPLSEPSDLKLLIGWTGSPASTTNLVAHVQATKAAVYPYDQFLEESEACVQQLIQAFQTNDMEAIKEMIILNRKLLNKMGQAKGILFETPALARLCDIAKRHQGVGKSSGAGGGDCGIAIFNKDTPTEAVISDWSQANIEYLNLSVYTK